jgi:autotransporter-associated beta strand protein
MKTSLITKSSVLPVRLRARRHIALRNTLLAAMAALGSFSAVHAQNGTWTGTSGSWDGGATIWSGNITANGTDNTANFTGVNINTNRTITVDSDRTIGNITFTDQTTASNSLAIAGSSTLTLDVTSGAPIINITQSGRSITFSAPLAGNDGLSKIGDGNLILSGNNTYSGNTTFSTVNSTVSAIFRISHNNALGSTSGGTTLFSGGSGGAIGNMIQLINGTTVTGETLTLQGDTAGTNMSITTGTSASTVAWEGNIIINGLSSVDARIGATNSDASTTLTIGTASTTITGNYTAPISVMGNGINDIQASIQTSGGITRVNAGTLRLSGNNTHTGNTTLGGGAGGALILANQFAVGNSTINITNGSSNANQIQFEGGTAYTLGGLASAAGGTAKNIALINDSSAAVALSVGNNNADTAYNGILSGSGSLIKIGSGNLTLSGNNTYTGNTTVTSGTLILADGGELRLQIGATGVNNQINGNGILSLVGDLRFDLAAASTTFGDSWNVLTVDTLTETFDPTFEVFSTTGNFTNSGGLWTITENSAIYQFSQATGLLSVIPEPTTWALLGGSLTALLAFRRRRQS